MERPVSDHPRVKPKLVVACGRYRLLRKVPLYSNRETISDTKSYYEMRSHQKQRNGTKPQQQPKLTERGLMPRYPNTAFFDITSQFAAVVHSYSLCRGSSTYFPLCRGRLKVELLLPMDSLLMDGSLTTLCSQATQQLQ